MKYTLTQPTSVEEQNGTKQTASDNKTAARTRPTATAIAMFTAQRWALQQSEINGDPSVYITRRNPDSDDDNHLRWTDESSTIE